MKKILCLLLCLVFVCSAFAGCNAGEQSGESTAAESTAGEIKHPLQVGYARVDITPQEPVPLGGLSNSKAGVGGSTSDRFFTDVRNPLYATCIAITDAQDNTVLIFHTDLLKSYPNPMLTAKMKIVRATGVPGNQIMICATHNHSGPDLYSSEYVISEYIEYLAGLMANVAVEAMADRKPARMYTASSETENLNFVRHYKLSDGSVAGDNFGSFKDKTILGHVTEVDNQLQLIKFTRDGGKDVVMMNYQGHPRGHGEYRYSILSHVDEMRKVVEAELDCHFAYFLGASGNVNSSSRITEENRFTAYVEHAQAVAQCAVQTAASFEEVEIGKLQIIGKEYQGVKVDDETATRAIPLFAISFGKVAFVTAPYEMFCENGMAIKEGSPFDMTFVATCANGDVSYIPSTPTFEYGGYEVTSNNFVKGTAEKLVDEYLVMLKQLYENP